MKKENLKIANYTREEVTELALKYATNIRNGNPELTDHQVYECVMKAGRGKFNPEFVKGLIFNQDKKLNFEKKDIF